MIEQHTPGQTSSIGAAWPPMVDTVHNRLRGFYTASVVETGARIDTFAASFDAQRMVAQTIESVDRLSVRLVAHAGALAAIEQLGIPVEAAIPLARTEPGLVLAYTGINGPTRKMSAEHLARHNGLLAEITAGDHQMSSKTHSDGPIIFANPADAEALAPHFLDLYAAFHYGLDDVKEILANSANTIAYVEKDGHIASTAMAERGSVTVDGLGTLNVAEITEASTRPEYRGQGLYRQVSGALAERLLSDTTLHAVYGESNLAMPGVLMAARENGRRFSRMDDYGLRDPGFGLLPQNFHVADGAENRRYNDFAVSYYPLR